MTSMTPNPASTMGVNFSVWGERKHLVSPHLLSSFSPSPTHHHKLFSPSPTPYQFQHSITNKKHTTIITTDTMQPPSPSPSQASFAAAVVATAVGSYIALSPPNPSAEPTVVPKDSKDDFPISDQPLPINPPPEDGHPDTIRSLALTHPIVAKACLAPLGILSLHTAALALYFPFRIPGRLLGQAAVSPVGINPDLISWSAASAIPMAVILCAGLPLRLGPYSALGRNFTFALAQPDRLTTSGIYKYVQHPSYVGLVLTLAGNAALLWRRDGVLSCWVPPNWMETLVRWKVVESFLGAGLVSGLWMLWKRTLEEEKMLNKAFGEEWEEWHAKTARFIPCIF